MKKLPVIALVLFAALLAVNAGILTNPPFWDDILGLHQQALHLSRSGMSYAELAKSGNFWQGGALVYRWNVLPVVYALGYMLLTPETVRILGHLFNLACLAGAAALAVRILLDFRFDLRTAYLWGFALLAEPVLAAQGAALGQEPPLVLAGALLLFWTARRRYRLALLAVILVGAVKLVAVIPAAALLVFFLIRAALAPGKRREYLALGAAAMGLAVLAGILLALDSDGAEQGAAGGPFLKLLYLKIKEHFYNYFPLIAVLLAALALLTPGHLAKLLRRHRRPGELDLFKLFLLLLLGGFWASYFLYSVPLPRYTAFAVAPLYLALALSLPRRWTGAAGAALLLTGLLLANGGFYPKLPPPRRYSGEYLERSREFLKQVALDREVCRRISADCGDLPLVTKWPYTQMFADPDYGYVNQAHPQLRCAGILPKAYPEIVKYPEKSLAKSGDAVYIFVCNSFEFFRDFGVPLAPRPGDRIIFAGKDLEAPFIVYRRSE